MFDMGRSAKANWQVHNGDKSCYFLDSKKMGSLFSMSSDRVENLHSIVHEINECEVAFILEKLGIEDPEFGIHITKKMCKKYPWIFKNPQYNICFTHLVSPYGRGNCALSRDKNRLRWK